MYSTLTNGHNFFTSILKNILNFFLTVLFFLPIFFYRITVHLMRHTYILANIQNMDNLCLTSFN